MAVFRYSRTMRSNTFMATEVSAIGRLNAGQFSSGDLDEGFPVRI